MIRSLSALALGLITASALSAPLTPSPDDWRDVAMYQIITDRWWDGDPSNNNARGNYNPSGQWDVHGGDFAGLEEKIYYVEGMGFEGVWISPIPYNVNGAFHGYAAQDFRAVDTHWGTTAELASFVAAAHDSGIRTMLDVVTNHMGNLITSSDAGWSAYNSAGDYNLEWRDARRYAAPFDDLSLFHAYGDIDSWVDPNQVLGELFQLDDLKTETTTVRDEMVDIWSDWVIDVDADGFRIDTVKHVDMGFWQDWAPRVRAEAASAGKTNFFMFGEVYDGSEYKVGSFTGTQAGGAFALDSCLDYPLYFRTNDVFAWASTGAQVIEDHYANLPTYYDPAAQEHLVTFLDNHDQARFLAGSKANNDQSRLEAALIFQLTSLGIPMIYYGTEQLFNGETDPLDREDMFDGQYEQGPSLGDNFDQTALVYRLIRQVNQLRRDHLPLRRGSHTAREVHSDPDIYAYSRIASGEEVIVAINTDPDNTEISDGWATGFSNGTVLADGLDPSFTVTINASGEVPAITLGPNEYRILIEQSALTNIEPEVLATTPTHDDNTVPTTISIEITFSEPMNTASTEAAFSTVPPRTGTFAWNASNEVMIFTPDTNWPGLSIVEVNVSADASDVGGAGLRGGFKTFFGTDESIIPVPEPPAPIGPLELHLSAIVVDGDASDWTGVPGSVEVFHLDAIENEGIWADAVGDDLGDGDYTYPTDASFTGGDADITEVRVAVHSDTVYVLIVLDSLNPGASFFTPYVGLVIDTDQIESSGRTDLGIEGGVVNGGADAVVSDHLAWERQIVVPGQNALRVVDETATPIAGASVAYSQADGVIELGLPFSVVGNPAGATWDLVVYTGLETFDQLREVQASNGQWDIGGGYNSDASGNDPDILDLAGSSAATQSSELGSYSGSIPAIIAESALVITFSSAVPVELSVFSGD